MTKPFDNLIAKAAGTDGVEYDGDFLTNATLHAQIKSIGADLGEIGAGIGVHEDMRGATAEAAREALGQSRVKLQGVEDALNAINGAAVGASAPIGAGKSNDPAVKSALASSEAEYSKYEAQGAGADDSDEEVESGQQVDGGGETGSGEKPGQGQENRGGTPKPGSPSTHVSSDDGWQSRGSGGGAHGGGSSSPTAPSAAQPVQQAAIPMAAGQPMGRAGGGMQQPGGTPIASPKTSTGAPSGKDEIGRMIREAMAITAGPLGDKGKSIPRGISPKVDPASDGGGVVATPVHVGNPTVTGGAVDPNQTSGRTTSTTTSPAPGSGVPMKPAGAGLPMGGGMMGGMGGLGNMGGNPPPAGPPAPPKIRRDKDTEKILTGEAARDQALISSILTDSDLILSDDGDTDDLLDGAPRRRIEEPDEDEKW